MNVLIDEERFAAAGLVFDIVGDFGVFGVPRQDDPETYDTVKVSTDGERLFFVPFRSAAHKRILALLG